MNSAGAQILESSGKRTLQIVLAEDNLADVMLVRLALERASLYCHLRILNDGAETIAFLENLDTNPNAGPIDLVLLDLNLPRRRGEEILKRLRSTENYAQTPVVVLTGSDAPSDHANAQKHAARHYFRKPDSLAGYMELGVIVRDLLFPGQAVKGDE